MELEEELGFMNSFFTSNLGVEGAVDSADEADVDAGCDLEIVGFPFT